MSQRWPLPQQLGSHRWSRHLGSWSRGWHWSFQSRDSTRDPQVPSHRALLCSLPLWLLGRERQMERLGLGTPCLCGSLVQSAGSWRLSSEDTTVLLVLTKVPVRFCTQPHPLVPEGSGGSGSGHESVLSLVMLLSLLCGCGHQVWERWLGRARLCCGFRAPLSCIQARVPGDEEVRCLGQMGGFTCQMSPMTAHLGREGAHC